MLHCTECGAELDDDLATIINVSSEVVDNLKGGSSKDPICEDCAEKLLIADAQCSGPFSDARDCPVHRRDVN